MISPQMQLFREVISTVPVAETKTRASILAKPKTDPRPVNFSQNQYRSIESALAKIFPTSRELTRVQRARQIMGDEIKELSDEDLDACLTEFQYLINTWFDDFERVTYNGQTLREVTKEV